MSSNDPFDFNNNDLLFNNIGFGPCGHQARSETLESPERRTTGNQSGHEHILDDILDGVSFADLSSTLFDVDFRDVLSLEDASSSNAQQGPWNPNLVSNPISRTSQHQPLPNMTSFSDGVIGGGQQQYPGSAPHAEEFTEEHDAHSSTNGISQRVDLSSNREPLAESTDSTSLDLSSASATSPHVCTICAKSFAKKADFKHHKRIHNPAKKRGHRCPTCGLGCPDAKDLRRHRKTHDAERERYFCTEAGCTKSYFRPDNVTRHRSQKHGSSSSASQA